MKLILSVDALSPPLTGIGRYTWELASRLPQQQGVDAVRYCQQGRWVRDPALMLKPAPSGAGRLRGGITMPRGLREWGMRQSCRRQVFHGPNYCLPFCADIGVMTVHDLSVFKFPETHPVERILEFERSFERSLSRAAHLITDSAATRREVIDFLAWPADKITAVPLGVAPTFAPMLDEHLGATLDKYALASRAYTLCVSTLEPRKKIDNLLRAYQTLPQRLYEQYPLVLAGSAGWLSGELHSEIERLSAQGWLRYLGFVPEADLPAIYAGARLFAYPSVYEGFGLPIVEAMASGVPVLTSDCSCLPEVAAGAAKLVNPDDIDALTAGLEEGLVNSEWREKAIAHGLQVAARYNWDECVKRTVGVYRRTENG